MSEVMKKQLINKKFKFILLYFTKQETIMKKVKYLKNSTDFIQSLSIPSFKILKDEENSIIKKNTKISKIKNLLFQLKRFDLKYIIPAIDTRSIRILILRFPKIKATGKR